MIRIGLLGIELLNDILMIKKIFILIFKKFIRLCMCCLICHFTYEMLLDDGI